MQVKPIEIEPHGTPITQTIIWLHGLGADGNDFVPISNELDLENSQSTRFIFPTAPTIPVTINNNAQCAAWYDIKSLDKDAEIDIKGIEASMDAVYALIEQEIARGIPAEHILLAGFSQGAVVALLTALCAKHCLKGVIALSGYLPALSHFKTQFNPARLSLPIMMQHGLFDPVVPLDAGQRAKDALVSLGYTVTWHTYPMPHSVCEQEIVNISEFINAI